MAASFRNKVKKKNITIIDYGMGNIRSLANAFNYLDTNVTITNKFDKIRKSEIAVLPELDLIQEP